jgi:crotonobetainyl-CoA:carnitine CoA-transferase CaiB-like acyl-CoA transferase
MLQPDRYWADLCRHLDRPDLVADERFADAGARFEHRRECVAELDEIIGSRTLAEWRERFETMEGVWAPMQSARELHDDPQAIANGYLPEVEGADGVRFTLVANPVQFDETSPSLRPAPDHGEQTDEVLLELGLSYDQILEHKVSGAVL